MTSISYGEMHSMKLTIYQRCPFQTATEIFYKQLYIFDKNIKSEKYTLSEFNG